MPPNQSAPPSSQEELVRKYSIVEKVIKLKKQINETLEKWMECYYHILFDNLPEDQLERTKIGELFSIKRGEAPPTKFSEYFCKEGGIPWVCINDLTFNKGKFILRGETNITKKGYDSCATYIVPENSILFSIVGSLGVMAVSDQKLCFNRSLISFLFRKENFPRNYYWFLLKDKRNELIKLGKGTTIIGISQVNLRNFEVDLPPRELISQFNQVCEPFFQLQKANEQEIRELFKLQKYFIELTN